MIFKNVVFKENNEVLIPYWNEDAYESIQWEEEENWDDIEKKYKISLHSRFLEFVGLEEDETERHLVHPYSVQIYQLEKNEIKFFLATQWVISEFEEITNCVALRHNYFNIVLFYREFCIPFFKINEFTAEDILE